MFATNCCCSCGVSQSQNQQGLASIHLLIKSTRKHCKRINVLLGPYVSIESNASSQTQLFATLLSPATIRPIPITALIIIIIQIRLLSFHINQNESIIIQSQKFIFKLFSAKLIGLQKSIIMKQSQNFQEWMKRYNANRQNTTPPTHGRLYQQKSQSFFGPTVCLFSRNNESTQVSHANKQKEEELLSKIVLLASLVQMLSEDKKTFEIQRQEWYTFERPKRQNQIRELNQKLSTKEQQFKQKYQQSQSAYKKQLQEIQNRFSVFQLQNNKLINMLKQREKQIQQIELKILNRDKELQSARMESSTMKQSIDIQRSRFKSQTESNQSLRGRVKRCEEIITDLKFIINGQKQQINKQRLKQTDITYKYEIQIDSLKKQLNQTHIKYNKVQEEQKRKWHKQIAQLQSQVNHIEGNLKDKSQIIEKQMLLIKQKDSKCIELSHKLEELQSNIHSKIIKTEQSLKLLHLKKQKQFKLLYEQRDNYQLQIESLSSNLLEIEQYSAQKELEYEQTINQLLSKLKQKEALIKKLKQRLKQSQIQPNTISSLHADNYNIGNRLRAQSSLDQIVTSFIQLKSSNDRSSKLIQTSLKGQLSRN